MWAGTVKEGGKSLENRGRQKLLKITGGGRGQHVGIEDGSRREWLKTGDENTCVDAVT